MNRDYNGFPDFGRRFGPEAGDFVRRFDLILRKLATVHVSAGVDIRTPRGASGALARSQQTHMPTGEAFGRVTLSAAYAQAINIGRKMSKPFSRRTASGGKTKEFSRRLGSRKQPRGMTRGAERQLRREWPDVVTEAAQRAEAGA